MKYVFMTRSVKKKKFLGLVVTSWYQSPGLRDPDDWGNRLDSNRKLGEGLCTCFATLRKWLGSSKVVSKIVGTG
jgi:hypothetical protein